MVTTRKKIKVIGTEQYIDKDGVLKDFQVIDIEEKDANFHKIWLNHIIQSVDLIGNQKTRLAFWIIENLNTDNMIIMTQRKISERTKMSLDTVQKTIKALVESNFLIKINSGAYQVNPDVIFKGGKNQRLNVLIKYRNEKIDSENQNEKIQEQIIEKEIEKCPNCDSELAKTKGKYGDFLGCPNFKKCGFKGKKIEG